MSKKNKLYMPSGSGGLVRYGEEAGEKIKIDPKHVIYLVAGVVVFEILMNLAF